MLQQQCEVCGLALGTESSCPFLLRWHMSEDWGFFQWHWIDQLSKIENHNWNLKHAHQWHLIEGRCWLQTHCIGIQNLPEMPIPWSELGQVQIYHTDPHSACSKWEVQKLGFFHYLFSHSQCNPLHLKHEVCNFAEWELDSWLLKHMEREVTTNRYI